MHFSNCFISSDSSSLLLDAPVLIHRQATFEIITQLMPQCHNSRSKLLKKTKKTPRLMQIRENLRSSINALNLLKKLTKQTPTNSAVQLKYLENVTICMSKYIKALMLLLNNSSRNAPTSLERANTGALRINMLHRCWGKKFFEFSLSPTPQCLSQQSL